MEPEVPADEVPDAADSAPLTPVPPAFSVASVNAPLDVAEPEPEVTDKAPPVALAPEALLPPASRLSKPPAPLSPAPTLIAIAPPVPPTAVPEPIVTVPVVPELDVPDLNTSRPDVPATPAFADLIVSAPLVVAVPAPDASNR
jgi:hypothetical protein